MENNEILDAYLFETNELLENLDDILINCEKNNDIDTESINGIFRIMHTIKGSSAMMEFDSMANVSHKIEDMFAYVRENGFDSSHTSGLFELLFKSSDFLKSELESIQNGNPLTTNIGNLIDEINNFLKKISSNEISADNSDETPAANSDSAASAPEPPAENGGSFELKVFFDPEAQMENLRAFMLLESVKEVAENVVTVPEDPQAAPAEDILNNGFILKFDNETDLLHSLSVVEHFAFTKSVERISEEPKAETVTAPAPAPSNGGDAMLKITFDPEAKMENLRAYMLLESVQQKFPNVASVPDNPQSVAVEEIINNGFLLKFANEDELNQSLPIIEQFAFTKSVERYSNAPVEAPKVAEQPKVEHKPADSKKKNNSNTSTSLINVNLSKLDKLIDLMGEIVITESMVTSATTPEKFNFDKFMKDSRQLQKLTNELQDNIMSIRMVPIGNVFNKMNRIVRDMSKKLEKDVELITIGEDTEVDKSIIDSISDPIMHIVRNSMDHGIETPDVRVAKGKPAKGKVTMKAENTVGEIVITISDDGKGFDKTKIMQKAKEKGLLKKPESEYTDKEIYSLVLMPGFSTNSQVTEYSGRGVGMDVVKSSIEKIGGSVSLMSKENQGTTISITIPLTLAIVNGMNVMLGDSIFTIPIHSIRQTFKPLKENIITDTHGNEMILIRNDCYQVVNLGEKLSMPYKHTDLCNGILLLVETHNTSYCIFVDSLIGEQQIVIKPVPKYLNSFNIKEHGISGCAILGDGSISWIVDVISLISGNDE